MRDDRRSICGFIGLGRQGAPIAERMARAGHPLIVWARRPETLAFLDRRGMRIAAGMSQVAEQADHVGICVDGDDAVREVAQQLLVAMRPGSRLVIHSTTLPETCIALSRDASERGIDLMDAPVSGGPRAASDGQLVVMIGGDARVVAASRPVLESFASVICHLGGVGTGQMAKLLNNALLAANLGLVHAVISAGVDRGLDRRQWMELLLAGSGRSYALEVYSRQRSLPLFSQSTKLDEKVRLLAEVLGAQHPTVCALRDAAGQLAC